MARQAAPPPVHMPSEAERLEQLDNLDSVKLDLRVQLAEVCCGLCCGSSPWELQVGTCVHPPCPHTLCALR